MNEDGSFIGQYGKKKGETTSNAFATLEGSQRTAHSLGNMGKPRARGGRPQRTSHPRQWLRLSRPALEARRRSAVYRDRDSPGLRRRGGNASGILQTANVTSYVCNAMHTYTVHRP
ncbi:hypothetical protein GWK47_050416 [Chionoecetes opilio]|uniref:Uncharacterized protein n=1 Tax=Chionoecetes opilio TaxID=41210 RepID=A0A8J4YDS4_CHIOP|nr:hypothetical protein GWK47_050416 [Chionoecetes opilio]